MTKISDLILEDNGDVLGRMLDHVFITSLTNGTLPEGAYHRYLVYEGAFVETAISIFAFATAKAPDLEARRWMVGVQDALVREQIPYFDAYYARFRIDTDIPMPRDVCAFDEGMLKIAQEGDFLEIVTSMFAAEWMYWTWCSRAARADIADPHIRQWIDLHADSSFEAQARWLKFAIDRYAEPGDRPRLSALFGHVTELEISFHTAPLIKQTEGADA